MKKDLSKIILAGIIFIIALFIKFENSIINNILFIIAYVIVGFEIILEAIENIFKGKFLDENFLMSIATIGAFIIGEFPEAVCVMLFYQIGEMFQEGAVDKSKKSIAELMNIRPDYANVIRDNEEKKVDPKEVKIGEIIVIKPGEKLPLDGMIIDGSSMLDTKAITGESVPRNLKVR